MPPKLYSITDAAAELAKHRNTVARVVREHGMGEKTGAGIILTAAEVKRLGGLIGEQGRPPSSPPSDGNG